MHVSRLCRLTREMFDCRGMQVPGADQTHEQSARLERYVLPHSLGLAERDCGWQPFDKRCITPHRDGIHLFAIECPHVTMGRLAEPRCVREHGIEDRLQITR